MERTLAFGWRFTRSKLGALLCGSIAACALLAGVPSAAGAAPTASVTITQYSPTVSGQIGVTLTGSQSVTVNVQLQRGGGQNQPPTNVATAQTTVTAGSGANGPWTATLTPSIAGPNDAFGASNDQLQVNYTQHNGATAPDSTVTTPGVCQEASLTSRARTP